MSKDILSGYLQTLTFSTIFLFSSTVAMSQGDDGYVGSKTCGMCHPQLKKLHAVHGHPNMLRPVANNKAPEGTDVKTPEGMEWKDISYLIGGSNVYARFLNSKGYVVTGQKAQYSMTGETLTPFKPDMAPGTQKYDCIKCHTTGWKASGSYDNGVKNDLEGIPGTWFENGVGCEACHGPGEEHVALKDKKEVKAAKGDMKIAVNKKAEFCGMCHKRTDDGGIIIVADDMLESRQQYSELMKSKKAKFKLACVSCHEPHTTVAGYTPGTNSPAVKKCESCHTGKFKMEIKLKSMSFLSCESCHMPLATRGAYDSMVKGYHKGDTHSHIFGISADPEYKLNDGTNHVSLDKEGYARLTVEMVCYSCHKAGISHDMTRAQMLEMAKKIH